MMSRMSLLSLLALLSQNLWADDTLSLPQKSVDAAPPSIVYKPFNESHIVHKNTAVYVQVTDESGVAAVNLYYRIKDTDQYIPLTMQQVKGSADIYTADVPWSVSESQDVEYFIEATDNAGNHRVYRAPSNISNRNMSQQTPSLYPMNHGPAIQSIESQSAGLTHEPKSKWYPLIGSMVAAGLVYSLAERDNDGHGGSDGSVTVRPPAP